MYTPMYCPYILIVHASYCVPVHALALSVHKTGDGIILNIHTPLTYTDDHHNNNKAKSPMVISRCLWYVWFTHSTSKSKYCFVVDAVIVSQNFDTFIVTGSGRALPTTNAKGGIRIYACEVYG